MLGQTVLGQIAECWKVLGEKITKKLVGLCKEMYVKGIWPSDFTRVVMIKKTKAMVVSRNGGERE